MEVAGRKVENQVQFWSLLGPFLILLSIAVLLFKVSPHWYFPLSALVGIPLCIKWKMKGMASALCCLFLLSAWSFQSLELHERYWHVGLSLAMAFSFIVLTLSWEEAQGVIEDLQLESQSRLENFSLLDEQWKNAEQEWSQIKGQTEAEIAALSQEVVKNQEDKQTFYKIAQLAKDEWIQIKTQHDHLLQDLLYKKQQIAQLHERLEETELTIQGFVNGEGEKQLECITLQMGEVQRENESLKAKLAQVEADLAAQTGAKADVEHEFHAKQQEMVQQFKEQQLKDQQVIEELKERLKQKEHDHKEKQESQGNLQLLQQQYLVLQTEKAVLQQSHVALQQQYEQLRVIELQQKQLLQNAQQRVREFEIKLEEEKRLLETLQKSKKDLEEQVAQRDECIRLNEAEAAESLKLLQELQSKQAFSRRYQMELEQKCHTLEEKCVELEEKCLSAEQTQEELRNALKIEQEECLKMSQALEATQAALQAHEEQTGKLKLEWQERIEHLNNSCVEKQEECACFERKMAELKAELEGAQHHAQCMRVELEAHSKEAEGLKEQVVQLKQLQDLLEETQQQLQLEKEKHVHQEKQEDVKIKDSVQDDVRVNIEVPSVQMRKIEGMYKQLREQFQEKCGVLDATRKELFFAQEELLRCQKEHDEEHVFDQTREMRCLQNDLFVLGKEHEHMQKTYQIEVEALSEVVESLLCQLSEGKN